jgi:hypothetical protein
VIMEQSERKPRHVTRSSQGQPKEEETQTYRVKQGQVWGTNPELQAGDTVELTEAEAAGFEDKLEEVGIDGEPATPKGLPGQLPAGSPQGAAVPKKPN